MTIFQDIFQGASQDAAEHTTENGDENGDGSAAWDLPAEPAAASQARALARGKLSEWGLGELDDLRFGTDIIVSELVTNALRHAVGPVRLRLVRLPSSLVCEVSDGDSTPPRPALALSTDESGRGLLLIAELTRRWGFHCSVAGKTVWAEQHVPQR